MMGAQASLFDNVTITEDGELRTAAEAEERFLASARNTLKAQGKTSIMALDLNLWAMTSDGRRGVTVESLRDGLSYLSPMLVSDADILAAITRANNFKHVNP